MKPAWENLDIFLDTDDFAIRATLRLQDSGERVLTWIFDDPYLNAETGEYELDTTQPRLTCRWVDVQDVTRGDTVEVEDEKVIVFCEFREVQRLLLSCIEVELGYSATIINGDTSASSRNVDSRHKRIRAFQEKPGFGVLILSPVAVGFGGNIQAANHVVHYMRTWNPAKEDQATDRAYRIGQTKDVHVYYPTVAADDFVTFDVKLDQLLTKKRELAGDMLNGSGDISGAEFDTMLNEQVGAAS